MCKKQNNKNRGQTRSQTKVELLRHFTKEKAFMITYISSIPMYDVMDKKIMWE